MRGGCGGGDGMKKRGRGGGRGRGRGGIDHVLYCVVLDFSWK